MWSAAYFWKLLRMPLEANVLKLVLTLTSFGSRGCHLHSSSTGSRSCVFLGPEFCSGGERWSEPRGQPSIVTASGLLWRKHGGRG